LSSRLSARLDGQGARVALWRGARIVQEVHAECDRAAPGLDDVIDTLSACLDELKVQRRIDGLRCDVVVADTWIAYDILGGDLVELQEGAADQVVRASLADTLGVKAEDLTARWQQQRDQRCLASALPRSAMDRLRTVLAGAGVRLRHVEGDFVRAFNERRTALAAPRAVLAVVRDDGTQFGLVVDRGLAAVRFEPGSRSAERLQGDVAGLLRCAGLGADDDVRCVADAAPDAALPDGWTTFDAPLPTAGRPRRLDLDLARSGAAMAPLRRLTFGAGIAAAIAAGVFVQGVLEERDRTAAEQSELQAALGALRMPRAGELTPAEARAAKGAVAVIRDLNVPWPELMAAFEGASGRSVALLAVEPTSTRDEVRFTGEAKSSSAMLDYLDALRGATLTEVTLISHQVQAQTPGVPIRFQARAIWTRPERTARAIP
jgi:hypothetical protein